MASTGESTKTNRVRRAVVQQLESLARAGVTHLPKGKSSKARKISPPEAAQSEAASLALAGRPAKSVAAPPPVAEPTIVQPAAKPAGNDSLQIVAAEVAACTCCPELASTRTQTVPGVGNPRPRLVFLGEAPGADEDRKGEPFVGRAGVLLTQIIENGMGLKRSDVFIVNILKCRPPSNRAPLPEEATNCRGFLDRQLALLKPEFICCLGAVAAQNLLASERTIGKMRGEFFEYRGSRVMCTYHPAYLLRNPAAKKDTWADIQMLMEAMGLKQA
ncbi:MAG: uracil-DNA glycosylase [Planctomycetia bacterium]|nr:uracil-DNA glycosylase [Planctomycetia bacterium]